MSNEHTEEIEEKLDIISGYLVSNCMVDEEESSRYHAAQILILIGVIDE